MRVEEGEWDRGRDRQQHMKINTIFFWYYFLYVYDFKGRIKVMTVQSAMAGGGLLNIERTFPAY